MSQDIQSMMLSYVEATTGALQLAEKIAREATAKQASASKVEALVQQLQKAKLIDAHETKLAAEQLADPGQSLDILHNVIGRYLDTQAKLASAQLGRPEKTASEAGSRSATSTHHRNPNYVGYIRGEGEKSAADEAILRVINTR